MGTSEVSQRIIILHIALQRLEVSNNKISETYCFVHGKYIRTTLFSKGSAENRFEIH